MPVVTGSPFGVAALAALGVVAYSVSWRVALRCGRRWSMQRRLAHATRAQSPPAHVASATRGRARWVPLLALAVVPIGAWLGVGMFSLVVASASIGVSALLRWAARLREPARYERALVAALEALARQLRGGAGLTVALAEVSQSTGGLLGSDLHEVHRVLARGERFGAALRQWSQRRSDPAVAHVVAGLGLGHASGALRARHVEELAEGLRVAQRAQSEAAAWASQAGASAVIMVVCPLAFSLLLATGDVAVRNFFLHTPLGWACLGSGLGLDLAAAAAMTKMLASVR